MLYLSGETMITMTTRRKHDGSLTVDVNPHSCDCTCLLCAVYGHAAVDDAWWADHTTACPEGQ